MEKKPVSRQGFEALVAELKDLQENQRPEILKVIEWARSLACITTVNFIYTYNRAQI